MEEARDPVPVVVVGENTVPIGCVTD